MTEDLADNLDSSDERYLSGLNKAVSECDSLIDDLLALSRIGRNKIRLLDNLDLGELLDNVLEPIVKETDVSILKAFSQNRLRLVL